MLTDPSSTQPQQQPVDAPSAPVLLTKTDSSVRLQHGLTSNSVESAIGSGVQTVHPLAPVRSFSNNSDDTDVDPPATPLKPLVQLISEPMTLSPVPQPFRTAPSLEVAESLWARQLASAEPASALTATVVTTAPAVHVPPATTVTERVVPSIPSSAVVPVIAASTIALPEKQTASTLLEAVQSSTTVVESATGTASTTPAGLSVVIPPGVLGLQQALVSANAAALQLKNSMLPRSEAAVPPAVNVPKSTIAEPSTHAPLPIDTRSPASLLSPLLKPLIKPAGTAADTNAPVPRGDAPATLGASSATAAAKYTDPVSLIPVIISSSSAALIATPAPVSIASALSAGTAAGLSLSAVAAVVNARRLEGSSSALSLTTTEVESSSLDAPIQPSSTTSGRLQPSKGAAGSSLYDPFHPVFSDTASVQPSGPVSVFNAPVLTPAVASSTVSGADVYDPFHPTFSDTASVQSKAAFQAVGVAAVSSSSGRLPAPALALPAAARSLLPAPAFASAPPDTSDLSTISSDTGSPSDRPVAPATSALMSVLELHLPSPVASYVRPDVVSTVRDTPVSARRVPSPSSVTVTPACSSTEPSPAVVQGSSAGSSSLSLPQPHPRKLVRSAQASDGTVGLAVMVEAKTPARQGNWSGGFATGADTTHDQLMDWYHSADQVASSALSDAIKPASGEATATAGATSGAVAPSSEAEHSLTERARALQDFRIVVDDSARIITSIRAPSDSASGGINSVVYSIDAAAPATGSTPAAVAGSQVDSTRSITPMNLPRLHSTDSEPGGVLSAASPASTVRKSPKVVKKPFRDHHYASPATLSMVRDASSASSFVLGGDLPIIATEPRPPVESPSSAVSPRFTITMSDASISVPQSAVDDLLAAEGVSFKFTVPNDVPAAAVSTSVGQLGSIPPGGDRDSVPSPRLSVLMDPIKQPKKISLNKRGSSSVSLPDIGGSRAISPLDTARAASAAGTILDVSRLTCIIYVLNMIIVLICCADGSISASDRTPSDSGSRRLLPEVDPVTLKKRYRRADSFSSDQGDLYRDGQRSGGDHRERSSISPAGSTSARSVDSSRSRSERDEPSSKRSRRRGSSRSPDRSGGRESRGRSDDRHSRDRARSPFRGSSSTKRRRSRSRSRSPPSKRHASTTERDSRKLDAEASRERGSSGHNGSRSGSPQSSAVRSSDYHGSGHRSAGSVMAEDKSSALQVSASEPQQVIISLSAFTPADPVNEQPLVPVGLVVSVSDRHGRRVVDPSSAHITYDSSSSSLTTPVPEPSSLGRIAMDSSVELVAAPASQPQ